MPILNSLSSVKENKSGIDDAEMCDGTFEYCIYYIVVHIYLSYFGNHNNIKRFQINSRPPGTHQRVFKALN